MFNGFYMFGFCTYWERILNRNRVQYLYLFRMAFVKNVQRCLRAIRGCGSFSFEMENFRVEHLRYVFDVASGAVSSPDHEPDYLFDKPGKTTRLLLDNAILPQQSPKDLVTFLYHECGESDSCFWCVVVLSSYNRAQSYIWRFYIIQVCVHSP